MLILGRVGQSTLNFRSHIGTLHWLHLTMLILGVDWHSTLEVTLELYWDYFWQCWSLGGQLTLKFGSHFGTLLGLPLTMLIQLGGGSIDTQLWKSLWNFTGITLDNVDPLRGVNGHSSLEVTLELLLGLPLTMLILGGLIDTQVWKSLWNFCWDYLWQCWSWGGSINTEVWKSLWNFAGITFDNVDPLRGSIDTQLWKSLWNFFWDYLWQCWSWGVDQHWHLEVTLELCWDYLWQCWSWWGVQSTLKFGSQFGTLLGLPLTMLIWRGLIDTQVWKSLWNFAGITFDNVDVIWPYLGDVWVIFRSPRVAYYTGYTFDFNVKYSYLYLFKI